MEDIEKHVFSDCDLSASSADDLLIFEISNHCTYLSELASFDKDDIIAMAKHFNITSDDLGG